MKVMQANDDKFASLVSSANLMIQKKHYASKQIYEVINRIQISRASVIQVNLIRQTISNHSPCQICTDQLGGLNQRLDQAKWEEEARDLDTWLTERENELKDITKTVKGRSGNESNVKSDYINEGEVAVRAQLEILQRQDKFQACFLVG